jgi:hypothetical protein
MRAYREYTTEARNCQQCKGLGTAPGIFRSWDLTYHQIDEPGLTPERIENRLGVYPRERLEFRTPGREAGKTAARQQSICRQKITGHY